MEIKESVNPVGEVVPDDGVDSFVDTMKQLWDETKQNAPWWQFWKYMSLVPVTTFLMKCLDDLIGYVDEFVDTNGADKKATVMDAMGKIYDYIIQGAMPIWLRPFGGQVRGYVLDTLVSSAIDWVVDKYRNGNWRKKSQEEFVQQLQLIKAQMVKP